MPLSTLPSHHNKRKRGKTSTKSIVLGIVALAVLIFLAPFFIFHESSLGGRKEELPPSLAIAQPPESLEEIEFCAEKCRYILEMCTKNKYREFLRLPAPTCLRYSTTVEGDIYWASRQTEGQVLNKKRNRKTVELVTWVAARARERRGQPSKFKCEEVPSSNTEPMMIPEEL